MRLVAFIAILIALSIAVVGLIAGPQRNASISDVPLPGGSDTGSKEEVSSEPLTGNGIDRVERSVAATEPSTREEKGKTIDIFVSSVGITYAAKKFDEVLRSEERDEAWAQAAEIALYNLVGATGSENEPTFYFECAGSMCFADYPQSVIISRRDYVTKSREWINQGNSEFLSTSLYIAIGNDQIRQYFFRDAFDVTMLRDN